LLNCETVRLLIEPFQLKEYNVPINLDVDDAKKALQYARTVCLVCADAVSIKYHTLHCFKEHTKRRRTGKQLHVQTCCCAYILGIRKESDLKGFTKIEVEGELDPQT